jgi:hypothetical protein
MLPTRRIADKPGKRGVISLHPYDQLAVVGLWCPNDMAVDEAEWRIAILMQGYLVIQQIGGLIEVLRAKFHVENAIGGGACRGSKNTAVGASGRLVGPIRSQYVRALGTRPAGDARVVE